MNTPSEIHDESYHALDDPGGRGGPIPGLVVAIPASLVIWFVLFLLARVLFGGGQ